MSQRPPQVSSRRVSFALDESPVTVRRRSSVGKYAALPFQTLADSQQQKVIRITDDREWNMSDNGAEAEVNQERAAIKDRDRAQHLLNTAM